MEYSKYLKDYKMDPQHNLEVPERLGNDGIHPPERKEFIAQLQKASGNLFLKRTVGPFSGDGPWIVQDSNSTSSTHISANTSTQLNGLLTAETRDGSVLFTSNTTESEFYVSYVFLK